MGITYYLTVDGEGLLHEDSALPNSLCRGHGANGADGCWQMKAASLAWAVCSQRTGTLQHTASLIKPSLHRALSSPWVTYSSGHVYLCSLIGEHMLLCHEFCNLLRTFHRLCWNFSGCLSDVSEVFWDLSGDKQSQYKWWDTGLRLWNHADGTFQILSFPIFPNTNLQIACQAPQRSRTCQVCLSFLLIRF